MNVTGENQADHPPPAEADWPRGYGESSWWPVVAAAGATGLYTGVGFVVLAREAMPGLPPAVGPLVAVGGFGLLLTGLGAWTYHGFVKRGRERTGGDESFRWGMWLFLATDVATFGAGFAYYLYVRAGPWPPGQLPELLSSLVVVNTVLLLTSSVTLHVAGDALRADRRRRFVMFLAATVVLGGLFLVGQLREYHELVTRTGFSLGSGPYASAFFGLTGLHGLHVGLGVVLLTVVFLRALAGQYSRDRDSSVRTVTLYWHFVDAVWLVLVVTLYVGAAVAV